MPDADCNRATGADKNLGMIRQGDDSMRSILLWIVAGVVMVWCGLCRLPLRSETVTVPVRLRLVDTSTGNRTAGLIRFFASDSLTPLIIDGLYPRLRGLSPSKSAAGWYVVPGEGALIRLPKGRLRCEAFSGLESARIERTVAVKEPAARIELRLPFLFRPEELGLVAGNTHLHLRNLTLTEADEYLRRIPPADRLKVVFISYLERHKDDRFYITNRYPIGDLDRFGSPGVRYSNGEEHRHNFEAYGAGYGHVMMLNIRRLVEPVSLGPGITGSGYDDRPLRPGIDDAHRQGGVVLWCHNTFGYEDVPSVLSGRIDALNVFDGSRRDRYEDTYYRYLNIGLKLPISTGTDWFLYDFSRVYAALEDRPTPAKWLAAVKAGRSIVTNGPMLQLTVNGRPIGETVDLESPAKVRIHGTAVGRHDFESLQLVRNGRVVHAEPARKQNQRYVAELTTMVRVVEPSWFALRIQSSHRNELDQPLFAHTSPVYVSFNGRRVFDLGAADDLLRMLQESMAEIRSRGNFSGETARRRVLAIYEEAIRDVQERMRSRSAK